MKESSVSKRPREETQEEEGEVDSSEEYSKRHRPYHHILSLLESEEEDPQQDLSSLITTLQQEITNSDTHQTQQDGQHNPTTTTTTTITALEDHSDSALQSKGHSHMLKVDEGAEENKERVMRHLLEASDDELGIPNTGNNEGLVGLGFEVDPGFDGDELGYAFCDGLWELEDETANYNALLQSQLFM